MKRLLLLTTLLLGFGAMYWGIMEYLESEEVPFAPGAGLTALLDVDCAEVSQQPLNLSSFQTAVNGFSSRLSQPESASRFLFCAEEKNPDLAETLMLYQQRLGLPARTDADVEAAFLHYVINRPESKLADGETADLQRMARSYRASLLLKNKPDTSGTQGDQNQWTLRELRRSGQEANHQRYGRDDVVPTGMLEFTESPNGYSHLNAVWMAEMSALAYWTEDSEDNPNPDLIDEQLSQWNYELIEQIGDVATDTSAFLASKDSHLVLSFRGTSGWKNFLTDVQLRKVSADWAKGSVHGGFKSALDTVWPQITNELGDPGQQQKDLWVTGHSLGAALAQLAALRLQKEGYRVQAAYTFGTPRVGDEEFVADYDRVLGDRTFPHINYRDVVTRVPPASFGFRATNSRQTRKFTGPKHEMSVLSGEPTDEPGAAENWQSDASESISKTTEFLPASLRPPSLESIPSEGPPQPVTYSADFERGPLDDHGSFEYLFKLACVAIEKNLWAIEAERANRQ